jgi:NADP-dependent 3-hydroxy acid dehydrogenase YdfG
LVVGASSGVGREVAGQVASAGGQVVLAARRAEALDAAAAEIRANGGQATFEVFDVADRERCQQGVEAAIATLGGLDALVYAAGISPLVMLREATHEDWRRVLDVNMIGASHVTATAVDALEDAGGRAVYVGSYSVRQSLPGIGLYSTSKVALDGLIEAWRMEAPNVDFTRALLGNTAGTEFANGWGAEQTGKVTQLWIERGLFPAPTMMPLQAAGEAIASVLAVRGYIDDIAIMPRQRDASAAAEVKER